MYEMMHSRLYLECGVVDKTKHNCNWIKGKQVKPAMTESNDGWKK